MTTTVASAPRRLALVGPLLALAGAGALAVGVSGLLSSPSCGDVGQAPCDPAVLRDVGALAAGIALSVWSTFLRAGVLGFAAPCVAVGVASMISHHDAAMGAFPIWFGGFWLLLGAVLLVLTLVLRPGAAGRRAQLERLQAHGLAGDATVTDVADTGITINDDPMVTVSVSIDPDGGGPAVTRQTRTLVPRVRIPRIGDRCRARYDRTDPAAVLLDFSGR